MSEAPERGSISGLCLLSRTNNKNKQTGRVQTNNNNNEYFVDNSETKACADALPVLCKYCEYVLSPSSNI